MKAASKAAFSNITGTPRLLATVTIALPALLARALEQEKVGIGAYFHLSPSDSHALLPIPIRVAMPSHPARYSPRRGRVRVTEPAIQVEVRPWTPAGAGLVTGMVTIPRTVTAPARRLSGIMAS